VDVNVTQEWRHRLFVAYLIAMALVFLTPTPETGIESRYVDKAVHLGLFLGLALVYYYDRRSTPGWAFLMSTMFAASVELVQSLLPYREGDWWDFVAGAAGSVIGMALVLWSGRRRPAPT
jgi:VanZ family protein